jgi:hypothetical protein
MAWGTVIVNEDVFANWLYVGAANWIDAGANANIKVDVGLGFCVEHTPVEIDNGGGEYSPMDFVHLSEELRSRRDHVQLAGRLMQVGLGRVSVEWGQDQ